MRQAVLGRARRNAGPNGWEPRASFRRQTAAICWYVFSPTMFLNAHAGNRLRRLVLYGIQFANIIHEFYPSETLY
jgi:hypothetical protein